MSTKVVDGGRYHQQSLAVIVLKQVAPLAARLGFQLSWPPAVALDAAVPARVYESLWIADCPDCGTACLVWRDAPYLMCLRCWNGAVGGLWRPVVFPEAWEAIESILNLRPLPMTRHWLPGETVAQLIDENREHGCAVPEGVI